MGRKWVLKISHKAKNENAWMVVVIKKYIF